MPKKDLNIFCWNVNGIRAIQKKGFPEWFEKTSPDILCLQETKAQYDQLDESLISMNGYKCHYFSAEKKGYSGVATFSKTEPLSVRNGFNIAHFDTEGRVLETAFEDFTLFNVYFPNGGKGPERVKYKLDFYDSLFFHIDKIRKKQKNIIICGDFNTAHQEIDLARPEYNAKNSGFLPIEREWIDKIINLGYIDVFREYNKEPHQYTYWDQVTFARTKNIGWRIDYFFVSKEMLKLVTGSKIHAEVMGSDHCPIELTLSI